MTHRAEFRANWRFVLASTLGMAVGLSLMNYTLSLFAPHLIADFGWTKSQFALVGTAPFVTMLFAPLVGRLTDHIGPRAAAAIGFTAMPLGDVGLSLMNGDFAAFFAIAVFKVVFGMLTTTMVFARVVVERFDTARGLALAIVMTGPPVCGMLAAPFIGGIIEEHGWRTAFRVLAAVSAAGGLVTFLLLKPGRGAPSASLPRPRFNRHVLARLLRTPVLPLALGGMLLVNLTQVVVSSQFTLVLVDSGATSATAVSLVALYAAGVAIGRVASGLAIDRIEVQKVALVALSLPAVGLAALASPWDSTWVMAGAVLLVGLAQGAEGDIGAYLISRKFGLANYSLLMSFMTLASTFGAASGALLLSVTLTWVDSYKIFLLISAGASLVGAVLFYLTKGVAGEQDIALQAPKPPAAHS